VRLYRIADARYGPESGEGARLYGGRWNSPGRAVIYACTTYAGAMLEKLVHTGGQIPKHQVCVTFDYPDDLPVTTLDAQTVPGWSDEDDTVSRRAGDAWLLAAQTPILLVPSVVFDIERNALINPAHPGMAHIRIASIEAIRWDDRLFPSSKSRGTLE
jgi:RES domain-containing protein